MGKKLTADFLKKLNQNAAEMAAEGASDEDIDEMAAAFVAQFGVDESNIATSKKKETAVPTNTNVASQSLAQSSPSSVSSKAGGSSQSSGVKSSGGGVVDYFKGMIQSAGENVKIEEEETKEQLKPVTQKLSEGKIGGDGVGGYLSGRAFKPKATKEQKTEAARSIVDRMTPGFLDEETKVKISEQVTPLVRDEDALKLAKDKEDKAFISGAGYQDILRKNDELIARANKSYSRENAIAGIEQSRTGKVAGFLRNVLNGDDINPQDEAYLQQYAPNAYKQILDSKKVNNLAEYAELRKPEVAQLRIQAAQQEVWPVIAQFKDVKGLGTEMTSMPTYARQLAESEQKEIDAIGNKYPLVAEKQTGWGGGMDAKYAYTTKRDSRYEKEVGAIKQKYQEQRDKAGLADGIAFAANELKTKGENIDPLKVGEQMLKTTNPVLYAVYAKGGKQSKDFQQNLYKAGVDVMRNSGVPQLYAVAQEKEKQYDKLYPEAKEKDVVLKLAIEKFKRQGGAGTWVNSEFIEFDEGDELAKNLPAPLKAAWERVKSKSQYRSYNMAASQPMYGVATENYNRVKIPPIGGGINEFYNGLVSPIEGIANTIAGVFDSKEQSANKALKDNWIKQKLVDRDAIQSEIKQIESKKALTAEDAKNLIELKSQLGLKSKGQEYVDLGMFTTGQVFGQGGLSSAGGRLVSNIAGKFLPSLSNFSKLEKGATWLKDIGNASKFAGADVAYLSSYGDAKIEANRLMPDANEGWKMLYANIVGFANAGTEHIFPDQKILDALKKEVSPSIAALVNNLSRDNITEASFNSSLKSIFKNAFTKYLPQVVIEGRKEDLEELTTAIVTTGGKGFMVAMGAMDESQLNFDDEVEGWKQTIQQSAIGGALPSVLGGISEVRRNTITKNTLYNLSKDPTEMDKLSDVIRYQQETGVMSERDAIDKLQTVSMLKDIGQRAMPIINEKVKLTEPDKAQLTALLLAENKLQSQIKNPNYKDVKSVLEKDLAEVEKQKDAIINGKVVIDDDLNAYTPEEWAKKNKAETQATQESSAAVTDLLNKQKQAKDDYIARNGNPKTKSEVEAYNNFQTEIATKEGVDTYLKNAAAAPQQAAATATNKGIAIVTNTDGTFDVVKENGEKENFKTQQEADARVLELSQESPQQVTPTAEGQVAEPKLTPLQQLKQKKDAVQEQEAGQVSVQPTTGVSGEVAQGVSESEPKGTPQEGKTAASKGEEKISSRVDEAVTINVGGKAITGVVRQDEGGKLTVESGGKIIEVDADTPFMDYASPVRIADDGSGIEINGEVFGEVSYGTDEGGEYALAKREDGSTKKITTPEIIEEVKYQAALMKLDEISDTEAYRINKQYESERKTPQPSKEGTDKGDGGLRGTIQKAEKGQPTDPELTDEERRLKEALDELDLIEKMADEELAQVESSAKLVQVIPTGRKEPKAYLVKKNKDGKYSATKDGRKVKEGAFLTRLGEAYEAQTEQDVKEARERLKQQVADLKEEVEAKFYGREPKKKEPQQAAPKSEEQVETNPALKDVESTAKAFEVKVKDIIKTPTDIPNTLGTHLQNITDGSWLIRDGDNSKEWVDLVSKSIKEINKVFEVIPYSSKTKDILKRIEGKVKNDNYEISNDISELSDATKKEFYKGGEGWGVKEVSEAYHKAKADGSNPELVKAVEELLAPKEEQVQQAAPAKQSPLQQIKAKKEENEKQQPNNISPNGEILRTPTNEEELAAVEREIELAEKRLDEEEKKTGIRTGFLPISNIRVRPDVFQFKAIEEEGGINKAEKLQGEFDENLAGTVAVWEDTKGELGDKGAIYVVDGHHRMEFAKRSGKNGISVFYIDAPNAKAARVIGAKANISQGRGTSIDAAKVFRDATPEQMEGFKPTSLVSKEGKELAKLVDSVFERIAKGQLVKKVGIAVAQISPEFQESALPIVAKFANNPIATQDKLIRFAKKVEQQIRNGNVEAKMVQNLFGEEMQLDVETAAIVEGEIVNAIKSDARLFSAVKNNKEVLEEANNQIDVEVASEEAQRSKIAAGLFEKYIGRASVNSIYDAAIKAYQEAKTKNEKQKIINNAANEIKDAIKAEFDKDFGGDLNKAGQVVGKPNKQTTNEKEVFNKTADEIINELEGNEDVVWGELKDIGNSNKSGNKIAKVAGAIQKAYSRMLSTFNVDEQALRKIPIKDIIADPKIPDGVKRRFAALALLHEVSFPKSEGTKRILEAAKRNGGYQIVLTNIDGDFLIGADDKKILVNPKDFFGTLSLVEDLGNYIQGVAQEEVIHLLANKLATDADYQQVYDEMTDEERDGVTEIYGQATPKNIGAEYVRMYIQNNVFGTITEKEGTKNKGLLRIINKVVDFLNGLIKEKPNAKILDIVKRFENAVNGVQNEPISGATQLSAAANKTGNSQVNESIQRLDKLSDKINKAKDTAAIKEAQSAYEAELKKDPKIEYLITNFGGITDQLQKLNLITKKGDC